jgi:HKD family nuclease
MTTIVKKLAYDLSAEIKTAEEIYVAVALMNSSGLRFILDNLQKTCRQNYLVGIDLPTDPKALEKLSELQLKSDINVRLYSDKEYFHPKLYLIKQKDCYSAFIGSANCTNGGLFENVELSIFTKDQKVCSELLNWFNEYFKLGKPLTTNFIEQYRLEHLERQERKKQEEKSAKKEKKSLNEEFETTLSEKSEFIKTLKQYRKDREYNDIVMSREQTIESLRKSLDYPAYQNINIDDYFKEWELGHLISIAKPAITRNISELRKLLHYLCNEDIDIRVRYDRALNGDLKVEGVSKAFISKVLVAHRPDLYFVKNNKSEKALRKYGITFPRGLTDGEKYKITCKFLRQICEDTNIKDLAVLDYYLYLEGSKDE